MSDESQDRNEQFLRLLNEHERAVSIYVHSLVPDWNAAQDVIQETRIALWKEFDRFELGTNFQAWAKTVAFYQVLTHRKKVKRAPTPHSEEFLAVVAEALADESEQWNERSAALRDCVNRLPVAHRRLITLRYYEERGIESVAGQLDRTEAAVYRALSRIRKTLADCVSRKLEGGAAGA